MEMLPLVEYRSASRKRLLELQCSIYSTRTSSAKSGGVEASPSLKVCRIPALPLDIPFGFMRSAARVAYAALMLCFVSSLRSSLTQKLLAPQRKK